MGLIQPKYTDTQRDAVRRAGLDLAMRPKEIQDAAKAGRLTWDGAPVPAFEIPASTAYSIVREERRKRDGRTRSQLLQRPHVDAVEELRRRMVAVADHETARMVDVQRKKPNDPLDGEHFRRLCRGLRELASLPEPGTQGERPGAHVPGQGLPKGEATASSRLTSASRSPLR